MHVVRRLAFDTVNLPINVDCHIASGTGMELPGIVARKSAEDTAINQHRLKTPQSANDAV
jgi:hypothetical protein